MTKTPSSRSFDEAFDAKFADIERAGSNVIPFPAAGTPRPALLAA